MSASPLATSRNVSGETVLHLLKALIKARLGERTRHNVPVYYIVIIQKKNEFDSDFVQLKLFCAGVKSQLAVLILIDKYNIFDMIEFELRRLKLVHMYQNNVYIITDTTKKIYRQGKEPYKLKHKIHNSHISKIFIFDVVSE